MATVTFAGSTIWNDATTGVGRIQPVVMGREQRWQFEPLPQSSGVVAKNIGLEAGQAYIALTYSMTNSEANALTVTVENLLQSVGSVVYNPGQTITDCVLVRKSLQRGQPNLVGATVRWFWTLTLEFQRLK